jgi:transposase
MAIELSLATWKLAFTVGSGQKPRIRSVPAGALLCLIKEIDLAKKRFGLPKDATVISCFEAGRDGFWVHRFLVSYEIKNIVVDSASIEVNRRKRRAKSDRLDAVKLVSMLIRWQNGEKKVWAGSANPSAWLRRTERPVDPRAKARPRARTMHGPETRSVLEKALLDRQPHKLPPYTRTSSSRARPGLRSEH